MVVRVLLDEVLGELGVRVWGIVDDRRRLDGWLLLLSWG